jgi:hypothetical protein
MAEQKASDLYRMIKPMMDEDFGPQLRRVTQQINRVTNTTTNNSSGGAAVSLAALTAHQALEYDAAHGTVATNTRTHHSIHYNIVGGASIDESNNLIAMLSEVGESGGGKVIVRAATNGDPIRIDKLVSIYHSDIELEFQSPIISGEAGGIRVMGAMDEFVRTATNAGKLASTAAEGDTVLALSTSASAMQASHFIDGDLITIRGQNGADGNALEKQILTVVSRDTGANTITVSEELEYDFEPTYPASEWPADLTTGTTIYVNRAGSFTANVARGAMEAEVTNIANFAVGDLVRVYDSRNENDMNPSAIRGSLLPYENVCNLEYVKITDIVPDGVDPTKGVVTFDQPLSKSYLFGTPYFGGIAKVLPVRNVRIHGARISYYEDQVSKNAHAISINFAEDCQVYDCTVDGIYGYQMTGDDYDHDVDGFLIPYGRMGQAIRISDSFNCWVYDCRINGAAHTGSGSGYGFANYKSTNCGVYNTVATGCRHNFLMQASTKWSVTNCQSWDDGISGIDVHGALEVDGVIANNILHRSTRHTDDASNGAMIRLGNTSHTVGCHHVVVQNNWCYGNGETNIAAIDFLPASTYLTIEGNKIHGGYYGIKNSKNPSQCVPTQTATHIVIRDNDLYDITNRAIYLEGIPDTVTPITLVPRSSGKADYVLVENNATWNCEQHYHVSGGDAITNLTVARNRAIDPITSPANDYYGLVVTDVDGLMIDGNNFHLCSRGISLTDGTNAAVILNRLTATIDAISITLAGTNTGPGGGALINVGNIVDNTSLSGGGGSVFTTNVSITNTQPQIDLYESDGAADNKNWRLVAAGESFSLQAVNDANTVAGIPIGVQRTGTTVDSVTLAATDIHLNGNVNFTGAATSTGSTTLNGGLFITDVYTPVSGDGLQLGFDDTNNIGDISVYDYTAAAFRKMRFNASEYSWLSSGAEKLALDTSFNLVATGIVRAKAGVIFHPTVTSVTDGYSINFFNDGSLYPLRFAVADDASNPRYFSFGRYVSGTWTPVFHINGQTGRVELKGSTTSSWFYFGATEDIYIRPGTATGDVIIADVGDDVTIGNSGSTVTLNGAVIQAGRVSDGNGGYKQHFSFTGLSTGVTVDILPNDGDRAEGVVVFGILKHSAVTTSCNRLTAAFYSGLPYNETMNGTDTFRMTCTSGGKVSITHYAGSSGTFSGSFDVYWSA